MTTHRASGPAAIERQAIDTLRTLAMDAVQAANSGHPGTPMALAPVAYVLWNEFLRYDPAHPLWPGRDRFVLSCGHASMLLYGLIHLAGVRADEPAGGNSGLSISLDDLRNFRQWDSRTPGHPEYGHTLGVETTTGPLGQGCGNSVGMAIAQRWLAERYNLGTHKVFDYDVYAVCSDGDLMEGVSCEAASLAGHLRLPNLCWIYDDNGITIEGETRLAFSEDVTARFQGLGWRVTRVDDANDLDAVRDALRGFAEHRSAPTLIIVRSHIGYGSPNKQDTADAHGSPLGADEVRRTKAAYGWPEDAEFLVPEEVRRHFAEGIGRRGASLYESWQAQWKRYAQDQPALAEQIQQMQARELPASWDRDLPEFPADPKGTASRNSAGKALSAAAQHIPWLVGGSADLAPSTKTLLTFSDAGHFQPDDHGGRNFHFGVREHAMGAVVNGMTLSALRAYAATFFVFSDYLRPTMRLAAMMHLPSIFVFTHDSIGVGEDGPTHQPVEHLAVLRAIPGLVVLRPADANEASQAWRTILQLPDRPAALVLTRQDLPTLDRSVFAPAAGLSRGGYVLADPVGEDPRVILLGSGSEVSLCVAAQRLLAQRSIPARVVSMPSWELFEEQSAEYRESVLPRKVTARVAIEAGIRLGWERYLGERGRFVGLDRYGASAPYERIYKELGITAEKVVEEAVSLLGL